MSGHVIGAILGGLIQGAGTGLILSSGSSKSDNNIGPDPLHIKGANITCICGAKMVKARYESIYGHKYDATIQCGKCRTWIGGHQYVYHCNTHDPMQYPHGYNICNLCTKSIQTKAVKQEKLRNLQQENEKLFNEIEAKMDCKQMEQMEGKSDEEEMPFMSLFKNGWMMKRGGYNTAWKDRYFELNGVLKTLSYYTESNKTNGAKYKLQGFIDFKKYPILRMMKSKKEQEFHVVTRKREWIFKCKDRKERDEWYNVIKLLCTNKK